MEEKILYTGKIHWIAYLQPVGICFIVWAVVLLLPNDVTWKWKYWIVYFFIAIIVYDFFYYRSIKIELTSEKVYQYKGFLPWHKTCYHLAYDQISECFYKQTILGRIFNYGTLVIAKSDGIRSGIIQRFLTHPKKFSAEFETVRSSLRKAPANSANTSVVEQLEKLIVMKRSGDISEEEFAQMKSTLLKEQTSDL